MREVKGGPELCQQSGEHLGQKLKRIRSGRGKFQGLALAQTAEEGEWKKATDIQAELYGLQSTLSTQSPRRTATNGYRKQACESSDKALTEGAPGWLSR